VSTPIAVHKPGGGPPPGGSTSSSGGGLAGLVKGKPAAAAAVGGVALVVIVALVRRGGGSQAAAGTPADQLQMTGGGSTYDSTANDLYNSIQPEIDALAKMMQDLQNKQPTPATPSTPAPTPTPLPAPVHSKPPTPKGKSKPKPTPAKPRPRYVTIRSGDTLSGIAQRSHISMPQLKTLNPAFWSNPKYHQGNTIWAGGKVRVK
jgi:LysM repeat protein